MRYLLYLIILICCNTLSGQANQLNKLIEQYHTAQDQRSKQNKSAWPALSKPKLQAENKEYQTFLKDLNEVDKSNLNQKLKKKNLD